MLSRADVLSAQVHRHLKNEILAGHIAPGERLIESRLAEQLQTSRSPVREALRMLQMEQLVLADNGAVRVFEPSYRDFAEIYEMRLSIEPFAAGLAAERWTDVDSDKVAANLEKTEEVLTRTDRTEVVALNTEFHQLVWTAARNERIHHTLEDISALMQYYCLLVFQIIQQQTNLLEEHRAIFEALKARDGEKARREMSKHVMQDLRILDAAYLEEAMRE
ncbi:MAG: GntR family transcriptional regulator [Alicyclobacillaceae bacterium]|nr:GntR family transcriptional regulator [Alicyclobacillaceae bacterium]